MEAAAEAERLAVQQEAEIEERRRQEKERQRQEQEEQRRQREEEAERQREEQRQRQTEERRRQEAEQAAAETERNSAEQKTRDELRLKKFLSDHGHAGINAKRTKMMKSKYPLHTAVKLADADMVKLLLAAGADPKLANSAGETPKQLARKMNKNESHSA